MQDILFICTGNTCRSPMAEAIANNIFRKKGLCYNAFSRGINVIIPSRASGNAVRALKLMYKLDLQSHVSKQVNESDMQKASIVLTMTNNHKRYLDMVYGAHKDKVFSIYGYVGDMEKNIKDPYGMDLFIYKSCAEELHSVIQKMFI